MIVWPWLVTNVWQFVTVICDVILTLSPKSEKYNKVENKIKREENKKK